MLGRLSKRSAAVSKSNRLVVVRFAGYYSHFSFWTTALRYTPNLPSGSKALKEGERERVIEDNRERE